LFGCFWRLLDALGELRRGIDVSARMAQEQ